MRLSLVLILLLLRLSSFAQFGYRFSARQEAYQPLTNSISINNNTLWDYETFTVPIGFSFILDDSRIDTCYLAGPTALFNDTIGTTISAFWTLCADFYDRGTHNGGISQSPLSYSVTGSAGSRICKMEIANAGFWDEYDLYSTSNDFINLQIWFYEGSNALELHYGPSKITHPADYFLFNNKPLTGLFRMSHEGDTIRSLYYLYGNPASPALDSISATEESDVLLLPHALDSMPATGTVYRFERMATGIRSANTLLPGVLLYPTPCSDQLILEYKPRDITYHIYSATGMDTGLEGKTMQGRHSIDVTILQPGSYVIELESGQRKMKFIKQ